MRLIYTFLLALSLSFGAYAATAPDAKQITQELEQAKAAKPAQPETVEVLQSALNALEERKSSLERARQYQDVIDNFPKLFQSLRAQLNNLSEEPRQVPTGLTADALNQEILQVSSQLLESSRQAQQEQDRAREIADSLNQLPQQQTDARRQLNEVERRIGTQTGNNALAQAQNLALQAESARLKALVDELDLAQLSANNRQELSRARSELAQKQSEQLDAYLQALRNLQNSQRQREAEKALESTELLAENSENLPPDITAQFKVNRELSQALNQQAQRMDLVASQQRQATNQTLQVRQALNTLREQSQWLGSSNLLGEALRAQVARLPERPRPQQLDTEMAQLRVQRLRFEDLLSKQPQLRQIRQADGEPLTSEQNKILQAQLRAERAAELAAARRRHPDAGAHQAEGRQRPAGRRAERDQRSHPPLSVLDFGRQPHRLLLAAGDRPGSAAPDLPGYHQRTGQSQRDDAYQQRDPAAAVCRPAAGWL